MTELVRMIGPNGPSDIAVVRPEWVAEWRGYGYVPEDEIKAAKPKAAKA
jgi:hypothetical protein